MISSLMAANSKPQENPNAQAIQDDLKDIDSE